MLKRWIVGLIVLVGGASACERATQKQEEKSDEVGAAQVSEQAPSGLDLAVESVRQLAQAGNYDEAFRAVAAAEIEFGRSKRLSELFDSVYDSAPSYNAKPRQVLNDTEVSAIKKLGGGSSLVYRLIFDKKTFAAFKPRQTRKQSNYRAEIAAYRLCPLMRCRFDVPENVPVWFDYRQFSGLYARLPSNPKDGMKDIEVVKTDEGDRIYGTKKVWVEAFGVFPIEYEELWMPWFGMTKEALKAIRVADAFKGISNGKGRLSEIAPRLIEQLGDVTAYELSLQLSNLLVFDYLINNWDRYSVKEAFWGVNCQLAKGRFMSIDNGAAFSVKELPASEENLKKISRFSRLTYETVKALDKEKTFRRLFDEPEPKDEARFETFWNRRERYMAYVDGLVAAHGEENVFFFE